MKYWPNTNHRQFAGKLYAFSFKRSGIPMNANPWTSFSQVSTGSQLWLESMCKPKLNRIAYISELQYYYSGIRQKGLLIIKLRQRWCYILRLENCNKNISLLLQIIFWSVKWDKESKMVLIKMSGIFFYIQSEVKQ